MSSYTFINSPLKRTQDGSNNSYVADYSQISGLESRLATLIRKTMNTYFLTVFRNNVIAKDPIYFGEENGRITIGCNVQPSTGNISDIEIGNDSGLRKSTITNMSNNNGNVTSWAIGTIYAILDNGTQIDISSDVNVTLESSNTNIAYINGLEITANGQNMGQTIITATYTYTYNGRTKTKTIQNTLTVNELAISSIRWTNTTAVTANTGSKPNMGTITLTWTDNSTTTTSSTQSSVALYTNSACTTALNYNNAISNQSIWAKYQGKITTNSKKLTLNVESPTIESIEWSSVLSLDFTMNDTNDYDFGNININYSNGQQETITTYNNPNCKFIDSTGSELDLNRTYTKRSIWCVYTDSNNRPYTTQNSKYLTLSEEEPQPVEEYYWYIGTTDPSTMTSISPVVTDTSSPGWRLIGNTLPTYSSSNMLWDGDNNNILFGGRSEYYIALPNNSLKLYNVAGGNEMDGCTSLGTKVINNVTYYVYKRNVKAAAFGFNIY